MIKPILFSAVMMFTAENALAIESLLFNAAKDLPIAFTMVKNCGTWDAGGRNGYYRLIVGEVYNGAGNEVYVQSIAVNDSNPELVKTLAFPELNNDHSQYAFRSVSCGKEANATVVKIEADYEHDEGDQYHEISIELNGVDNYKLTDKIKKP